MATQHSKWPGEVTASLGHSCHNGRIKWSQVYTPAEVCGSHCCEGKAKSIRMMDAIRAGVPARRASLGDNYDWCQTCRIYHTGDGLTVTQTRGWVGWGRARKDRLWDPQRRSRMPAVGNMALGRRVSKICSSNRYFRSEFCRRPKALCHSPCKNLLI